MVESATITASKAEALAEDHIDGKHDHESVGACPTCASDAARPRVTTEEFEREYAARKAARAERAEAERLERERELSVPCPKCKAAPQRACRRPNGLGSARMPRAHKERRAAALEAVSDGA